MLNIQSPGNEKSIKISFDIYSKIVLSVIAVCLLLITFNIFFGIKNLSAYETVQDVNIKSINGSGISGSEIPVNLKKVDGSGTSDGIPVDIQSIKGRGIFGDKLPIDIQSINGQFIFGGTIPVTVR